jgi:hypothetical protein
VLLLRARLLMMLVWQRAQTIRVFRRLSRMACTRAWR